MNFLSKHIFASKKVVLCFICLFLYFSKIIAIGSPSLSKRFLAKSLYQVSGISRSITIFVKNVLRFCAIWFFSIIISIIISANINNINEIFPDFQVLSERALGRLPEIFTVSYIFSLRLS